LRADSFAAGLATIARMSRAHPFAHRVTILVLAIACSETPSEIAGTTRPVSLAFQDSLFDVVTRPIGALGMMQISSGTLIQPMGDHHFTNGEGFEDITVPIRATCGLTFVTPIHAITAGHCVDEPMVKGSPIAIQMYKLGPGAETSWEAAAELENIDTVGFSNYPQWTHDPVADYEIEPFECELLVRCGSGNGPLVDCPGGAQRDIAVLECPSRPGCAYDYASVAPSESIGDVVAMAWAHEVYDSPGHIESSMPMEEKHKFFRCDLLDPDFSPTQPFNMHYIGSGINQLLPLLLADITIGGVEVPTTIRTDPYLVTVDGSSVWITRTSLNGCHGTSGSGIFRRNAEVGAYELLGPVVTGTTIYYWNQGPGLCGYVSTADPLTGEAYTSRDQTDLMFTPLLDVGGSCGDRGTPAPPLLWSAYDRHLVPEIASGDTPIDPWPGVWPCTACPAWERLRTLNEPIALLEPDERLSLPEVHLERSGAYRMTFRTRDLDLALPPDPCDGDCTIRTGMIYAAVDGTPLTADPPVPRTTAGEYASLASLEFVSPSEGAFLEIVNTHITHQGVTDIQIVPIVDGLSHNAFFDRYQRASAVLESGGATSPMRFVGAPGARFNALLHPGERMYLRREALTVHDAWIAQVRTRALAAGLVCGLLFRNGTEVTAPCEPVDGGESGFAGTATLEACSVSSVTRQPVAFFVEMSASGADVQIESVSLGAGVPVAPCR
jgi:hypothetical protein